MDRLKNILFVVEADGESEHAMKRAVALAESNQAKLTVVATAKRIESPGRGPKHRPSAADLQRAVLEEQQQTLDAILRPHRRRLEIQSKVLTGIAFLEVIREVLREGHDLVIKVCEPTGWFERVRGSGDMHLLRKCPCPVWLVRPEITSSFRQIVAAVDVDSDHPPAALKIRRALNRQILDMAFSLALSESADLHVVHVWEAIGESAMRGAFLNVPDDEVNAYVEEMRLHFQRNLDALMAELDSSVGEETMKFVQPRQHLIKGAARDEIPSLVKSLEADLVVMGTVARVGVPGFFLGNTAETILHRLECSVLAIKPPGFVSPVTLDT